MSFCSRFRSCVVDVVIESNTQSFRVSNVTISILQNIIIVLEYVSILSIKESILEFFISIKVPFFQFWNANSTSTSRNDVYNNCILIIEVSFFNLGKSSDFTISIDSCFKASESSSSCSISNLNNRR